MLPSGLPLYPTMQRHWRPRADTGWRSGCGLRRLWRDYCPTRAARGTPTEQPVRRIETFERKLERSGVPRAERGGVDRAHVEIPVYGDSTGLDLVEARSQPIADRRAVSPQKGRRRSWLDCGRYRPTAAAILSLNPDQVQLARRSRAPGFNTRAIADIVISGNGENLMPSIANTMSKFASGSGSVSAKPSSQRICSPS